MTFEEKAQKYTIDNVCDNCNNCQSKGYIGCDTFRFAKKAYLDRAKEEMLDPFGNTYVNDLLIENKELREENMKLKEMLEQRKSFFSNTSEGYFVYDDPTSH